eukprot:gb/GECG01007476.1/.p1 GENE.gb/GECG01007476.1/~~gb/GECG01007476.1/.p1  ORF type:complete len:373 (+),score=74.74 gb/GECG01007476.1/:1-1119(+)
MGDNRTSSSSQRQGNGGDLDMQLHRQAMQAVRTRAQELLSNGQMSTDNTTIYKSCESSKMPSLIIRGMLMTGATYGILGVIGRKYPKILQYRTGPALLVGYGFYETSKNDDYTATMCERILMARPGDGDTEDLRNTYARIYPSSEFYNQCTRLAKETPSGASSIRNVVDPWPITQRELREKWVKEVRKQQGKETPEYRKVEQARGDSNDTVDEELSDYFVGKEQGSEDEEEGGARSAEPREEEEEDAHFSRSAEPPVGWVAESDLDREERGKHSYGEAFDAEEYFRGESEASDEKEESAEELFQYEGSDDHSKTDSEDEFAQQRLTQADRLALERRKGMSRNQLRREKRDAVLGKDKEEPTGWEEENEANNR